MGCRFQARRRTGGYDVDASGLEFLAPLEKQFEIGHPDFYLRKVSHFLDAKASQDFLGKAFEVRFLRQKLLWLTDLFLIEPPCQQDPPSFAAVGFSQNIQKVPVFRTGPQPFLDLHVRGISFRNSRVELLIGLK